MIFLNAETRLKFTKFKYSTRGQEEFSKYLTQFYSVRHTNTNQYISV